MKLWKVSERDKRPEGYNLKDEEGRLRDPATITTLRVSVMAVPAMPFDSLGHRGQGNAPPPKVEYMLTMAADDDYNMWLEALGRASAYPCRGRWRNGKGARP